MRWALRMHSRAAALATVSRAPAIDPATAMQDAFPPPRPPALLLIQAHSTAQLCLAQRSGISCSNASTSLSLGMKASQLEELQAKIGQSWRT